MFKKLFATSSVAVLITVSAVSFAQQMNADEKAVADNFKKILKDIRNLDVNPSARKTEIDNIYELIIENNIQGYTDRSGSFILNGPLINPKNLDNLTAKREEELNKVDIKTLPLNQAIKVVNGNGKRKLYTVEDPRCTYCKKLGSEVREMKDVTVYIFPVAFLGDESYKRASSIMCSKDPAKAWFETLFEEKIAVNDGKCKNNFVDANTTLAKKLRVQGTPAIIFEDGSRIGGYAPVEQIEKKLATIK